MGRIDNAIRIEKLGVFDRIAIVTKVHEIEAAISKLPKEEFFDLARWFDEERNRAWDRQLENDARSGKLRKLYEKLNAESGSKPEILLNEVLDDPKLS